MRRREVRIERHVCERGELVQHCADYGACVEQNIEQEEEEGLRR